MSKWQTIRHARPDLERYVRSELHHAASDGDVARANSLLASGVDPALPDDDGWTPSHIAAQALSVATCEVLLRAGAAVDRPDNFGNAPFLRAMFAFRGSGEVIALLLQHGADPNRTNTSGVPPARRARTISNYHVPQRCHDLPLDDGERTD